MLIRRYFQGLFLAAFLILSVSDIFAATHATKKILKIDQSHNLEKLEEMETKLSNQMRIAVKLQIAKSYEKRGYVDFAIQKYKEVAEGFPYHSSQTDALKNLVRLYIKENRFKEAEKYKEILSNVL